MAVVVNVYLEDGTEVGPDEAVFFYDDEEPKPCDDVVLGGMSPVCGDRPGRITVRVTVDGTTHELRANVHDDSCGLDTIYWEITVPRAG